MMVEGHAFHGNVAKDYARVRYGDCYVQAPITVLTIADSATKLIEESGKTLDTLPGTRLTTGLDFIVPNVIAQLILFRLLRRA